MTDASRSSDGWKAEIIDRARRDDVFCALVIANIDAVLKTLSDLRAQLARADS